MEDYYEILRIHPSATQDEIKEAYRRLAHKYHPDTLGGNAMQFKKISEAYNILSDPYQKGRYDMAFLYEDSPRESEPIKQTQVYEKKDGLSKSSIIFICIIVFAIFLALLSS